MGLHFQILESAKAIQEACELEMNALFEQDFRSETDKVVRYNLVQNAQFLGLMLEGIGELLGNEDTVDLRPFMR